MKGQGEEGCVCHGETWKHRSDCSCAEGRGIFFFLSFSFSCLTQKVLERSCVKRSVAALRRF